MRISLPSLSQHGEERKRGPSSRVCSLRPRACIPLLDAYIGAMDARRRRGLYLSRCSPGTLCENLLRCWCHVWYGTLVYGSCDQRELVFIDRLFGSSRKKEAVLWSSPGSQDDLMAAYHADKLDFVGPVFVLFCSLFTKPL